MSFCTVLLFGLIFAVAVVATAPVSVTARFVPIPSQIEGLFGSIWSGRAALVGGHDLAWRSDPWSLLSLGLRTEIVLSGDDTQLTGMLRTGPGSIVATDVSGRAGPGLLALADGMPAVACTSRGVVDIARLAAGRGWFAADGTITIDEGDCTEPGGRVTPVPAMRLILATDGDDATARLASGETLFLTAIVRGSRRLELRVEPEGARNVPGLPTGGPIILEYPF